MTATTKHQREMEDRRRLYIQEQTQRLREQHALAAAQNAVAVRDLTDRLTVGRKVDRVASEFERQQAELDRLIRTAREVDAAAAEARKGQTVEQIIDAGFDNL